MTTDTLATVRDALNARVDGLRFQSPNASLPTRHQRACRLWAARRALIELGVYGVDPRKARFDLPMRSECE